MQQHRDTRGSEIASIRGMLVSVQSRLEHHEGTHWSLTVRLSDGTATVDADVEDDLLRRLIGLSAVEAEAMRKLGRQGDVVRLFVTVIFFIAYLSFILIYEVPAFSLVS